MLGKFRMRQFHQSKWKPYTLNDRIKHKSIGTNGILWELNKVDRQINTLQLEISILQQQLKIMKSCCAAAPASNEADQPDSTTRYFCVCKFNHDLCISNAKNLFAFSSVHLTQAIPLRKKRQVSINQPFQIKIK